MGCISSPGVFQNPRSDFAQIGRNRQPLMLYSPARLHYPQLAISRSKRWQIMKRTATLISLIILAAVSALAQSASKAEQGQKGQGKGAKTEFFPVDQVKPGMRAIGYTVFSGSEPRKF